MKSNRLATCGDIPAPLSHYRALVETLKGINANNADDAAGKNQCGFNGRRAAERIAEEDDPLEVLDIGNVFGIRVA